MPDFGDYPDGQPTERYRYQGAVDPNAPSVANGQITPAQWAEYQARRRKDALLGTLLTLGGMFGAQPLANAIGLGGSGTGAAVGNAASGALPALEGGAPWAVTPYAGTASMSAPGLLAGGTGAGVGAGAGAGVGAASVLGMSPRDWLALATGTAGMIGSAMSQPSQTDLRPSTATDDPELRALLQLMRGRLQKQEPLYDSILAMANGLLPTQYQRGGGG